jgi:hypothetical protein
VKRAPIRVLAAAFQTLAVIAIAAVAGCGGPPRPPERPTFQHVAVNQRGVGIPYGAVVLFRVDQEVVALRIVEAPMRGYRIQYEWNVAKVTTGAFETEGTGAGETGEHEKRCAVHAGPLYMRWSRGSEDFGWLYWPEKTNEISVSSITFRSVKSIDLKDPGIFWYTQDMFE